MEQAPLLIVEDNTGDVLLVRQALKLHGLLGTLTVATNGEDAVDLIDQIDNQTGSVCPRLIILDLNLPRKSGLDVLKRIRESPRCSTTPVVILSTSDDPNDRQTAEYYGAHTYIRKPSSLPEYRRIGAIIRATIEAAS